MSNKGFKKQKVAENIPMDKLRRIVDKTVNQNPKVFERLAEI